MNEVEGEVGDRCNFLFLRLPRENAFQQTELKSPTCRNDHFEVLQYFCAGVTHKFLISFGEKL